MTITQEMVSAAHALVPSLTETTVRRMLEAALLGQIVINDGAGSRIVDGKSRYPLHAQVVVDDPYRALDLASQLLLGARSSLIEKRDPANITLLISGDGYFF